MTPAQSPSTSLANGTPPPWEQLGPAIRKLVDVIAHLRSPAGCPWDRAQTLASIKPYTLEETYELLEAIDSGDDTAIAEELGDVLLQVVLDAQIAADEQRFNLIDVTEGLTRKMIERHPHVFGTETANTAADVHQHWERAKQREKQHESALDGIPTALPALAYAARLTKKAARVGYDFPDRDMLFDKLREETDEVLCELYPTGQRPTISATVDIPQVPDEPISDPARLQRAEGEIGDLLFVVANIARRWGINPEEALRRSNAKFRRRFQAIEQALTERGRSFREANLPELEALYQAAKSRESK